MNTKINYIAIANESFFVLIAVSAILAGYTGWEVVAYAFVAAVSLGVASAISACGLLWLKPDWLPIISEKMIESRAKAGPAWRGGAVLWVSAAASSLPDNWISAATLLVACLVTVVFGIKAERTIAAQVSMG